MNQHVPLVKKMCVATCKQISTMCIKPSADREEGILAALSKSKLTRHLFILTTPEELSNGNKLKNNVIGESPTYSLLSSPHDFLPMTTNK